MRELASERSEPHRSDEEDQAPQGWVLDVVLDDGTGEIVLCWVGRKSIAGIDVGAVLEVEGTVCGASTGLCILNPLYRFAAPPKG
jgi:hypothetical protein